MKIAITGHTSGIGKELFDRLSIDNEVIGLSRSNGFDISINRAPIVKEILDADLFINNAYDEFGQMALFLDVLNAWRKDESKFIINIASLAKYPQISRRNRTRYAVSKTNLARESLNASFNEDRKCRLTCINPGWVGTKRTRLIQHDKMHVEECADMILSVINQPIDIFELSFNRRQ